MDSVSSFCTEVSNKYCVISYNKKRKPLLNQATIQPHLRAQQPKDGRAAEVEVQAVPCTQIFRFSKQRISMDLLVIAEWAPRTQKQYNLIPKAFSPRAAAPQRWRCKLPIERSR